MRSSAVGFMIVFLVLIAFLLVGCTPQDSSSGPAGLAPENASGRAADNASDGRIEFAGVSFALPRSLGSSVVPEKVEVRPLGSPTDKPDWVAPAHTSFRFGGAYAKRFEGSFFPATLDVYPIEEYRKQLAVQKPTLAQFDSQLSRLRGMLKSRIVPAGNNDLPLLKYVDASEEFHARVKYVEFSKGHGLAFITQYSFEPALINNKGLTYVFQGLTDDGRYYVLGTFPLSVASLPESYDISKSTEYELPLKSLDDADRARYDDYVRSIRAKLEGLPEWGFSPSLIDLDRITSTLKID